MKKGSLALLPSGLKGLLVGYTRQGWPKFYTSKGPRVVRPWKVKWLNEDAEENPFAPYDDLPPGF